MESQEADFVNPDGTTDLESNSRHFFEEDVREFAVVCPGQVWRQQHP